MSALQGLALPTRSAQVEGVLRALMSKLERDRENLSLGEGDSQYCENFAITVFTRADKADRAGRADKNTAMTFYAASIFFEVTYVQLDSCTSSQAGALRTIFRAILSSIRHRS